MNSGSITFSFDCEGKWGMMDHPKKWNANKDIKKKAKNDC